jgi:hypothetical protein
VSTNKPIIHIASDGRGTARVLLNGEDISNHVTAVNWHMSAGSPASAIVELYDVTIDADGRLDGQVTHRPKLLESEDADQPGQEQQR